MGRLSWFVLSIAILTLVIVTLTTRMGLRAEETVEALAEKREWGEEVNGFRISIQAKDYDDKEYGPVILSIILENAGKETVTYSAKLAIEDYGLIVKDRKGNEVPRTRYGVHISQLWAISGRKTMTIAPEEQQENSIVASRISDMTLPGTYTIAATISIRDPESKKQIPVKSNTITVKVPN